MIMPKTIMRSFTKKDANGPRERSMKTNGFRDNPIIAKIKDKNPSNTRLYPSTVKVTLFIYIL